MIVTNSFITFIRWLHLELALFTLTLLLRLRTLHLVLHMSKVLVLFLSSSRWKWSIRRLLNEGMLMIVLLWYIDNLWSFTIKSWRRASGFQWDLQISRDCFSINPSLSVHLTSSIFSFTKYILRCLLGFTIFLWIGYEFMNINDSLRDQHYSISTIFFHHHCDYIWTYAVMHGGVGTLRN